MLNLKKISGYGAICWKSQSINMDEEFIPLKHSFPCSLEFSFTNEKQWLLINLQEVHQLTLTLINLLSYPACHQVIILLPIPHTHLAVSGFHAFAH